MDKVNRKLSNDKNIGEPLPLPPPDPKVTDDINLAKMPESYKLLLDYKKREETFLANLKQIIELEQNTGLENVEPIDENLSNCHQLFSNECENYIRPFLNRADVSVSAVLATQGSLDQLSRLHELIEQLVNIQNENFKMRNAIRDVETISGIKKLQNYVSKVTDENSSINDENLDSDNDMAEIKLNECLLETILATGKTAMDKRNGSKKYRQRSFSLRGEELTDLQDKELKKHLELRRLSVMPNTKSKVSKWTKVKAAFKWERANVVPFDECKTSDFGIGLYPVNTEVARYLRVPSVPCAGSSADSVLSTSSGAMLNASFSPTSGSASPTSSMEDIDNVSEKKKNYKEYNIDSIMANDEFRHSKSFDGDAAIKFDKMNAKLKTPWRKVKDIIQTHRGSLKRKPRSRSVKSNNSIVESREGSPTDSCTPEIDRTDGNINNKTSDNSPSSQCTSRQFSFELQPNRKSSLDVWTKPNKIKPNNTNQLENIDLNKWSKELFYTNSSTPSSPSKLFSFFEEIESDDRSSGDISDSYNKKKFTDQVAEQEEIKLNYKKLKNRISLDLINKQREYSTGSNLIPGFSSYANTSRNESESDEKSTSPFIAKPIPIEFKKKMDEWILKKNQISQEISSNYKETETKKIDWQLWKTGQIKLDGQGLTKLPEEKDLPEDFQKKMDDWMKMKSLGLRSNSSDSTSVQNSRKKLSGKTKLKETGIIEKETQKNDRVRKLSRDREKPDKLQKLKSIISDVPTKEVTVQTSKGVLKFEGISRKFTRKLYEWEKARGIGPESSTFALLHPGYSPLDVGVANEDNNVIMPTQLIRSKSMYSVASNPTIQTVHQASSLSLNDIDEFSSMQKEGLVDFVDNDQQLNNEEVRDEPEAVLVEVEDDYIETAAPLITPVSYYAQQTPIYKYEDASTTSCNLRPMKTFKHQISIDENQVKEAIINANNFQTIVDTTNIENAYSKNISPVQDVLQCFVNTLPILQAKISKISPDLLPVVEKSKLLSDSIITMLEELGSEAVSPAELKNSINIIDGKITNLRKLLNVICHSIESNSIRSENIPDIYVTEEAGVKETAIINDAPYLFQTEVVVNEVKVMEPIHIENDFQGHTKESIENKKPIRNSSFGTMKKKTKLRRIGSKQSSKTDTDSDEESPRRVKRKNSRAKKNSAESFSQSVESNQFDDTEGITYVLNIKQLNDKDKQTSLALNIKDSGELQNKSYSTLNSPEHSVNKQTVFKDNNGEKNIFVETKRQMFSLHDNDNVISQDKTLDDHLQSKDSNFVLPQAHTNYSIGRKNLGLVNFKEPSPTKIMLLSRYNQKLVAQRRLVESNSVDNPYNFSSMNVLRSCSDSEMYKKIAARNLNNGSQPIMKQNNNVSNIPLISCDSLSKLQHRKHLTSHDRQIIENYFRKNPCNLCDNSNVLHCGTSWKLSHLNLSSQSKSLDKSNNIGPRISRKYEIADFGADFQLESSVSSENIGANSMIRHSGSSSSVSERARKLRKAKEVFLQICDKTDSLEAQSSINLDSDIPKVTGNNQALDESMVKVDEVLTLDSENAGLEKEDRQNEENVANKKFALLNFATKFRKNKLQKSKKNISNLNAISTLCKQTLIVDVDKPPIISPKMSDKDVCDDNKVVTHHTQIPRRNSSETHPRGLGSLFWKYDKRKVKKSKSTGCDAPQLG